MLLLLVTMLYLLGFLPFGSYKVSFNRNPSQIFKKHSKDILVTNTTKLNVTATKNDTFLLVNISPHCAATITQRHAAISPLWFVGQGLIVV